MDQVIQRDLMKTCRERIRRGVSDVGEAEIALDVDRYVSTEQFAAERDTLFRDCPIAIGFASQVREPGSYITYDVGDVPIVALRDRAGALRAFMNVCRHRGSRLLAQPSGCGLRAITCPYHAWTYELTSGLRHIPHGAEGFPDLDHDERPLVALPVAERHGLIFVTSRPAASGAAVSDIDAYLGPLIAELDVFGFADHVLYAPTERLYRMNWKLLMDTTYETYHFRFAHAQSIYPMFLDNTGVFDWAEPHARMVLPKRTIREIDPESGEGVELRAHANIIYGIFPNTIVLVQPDHAMVMSAFPKSADETIIRAGMLIPEEPANDKAVAHWDKNEAIFWEALDEDFRLAESMQSTHRSGANRTILFGRYEHLAPKFHAAVDQRIGRAPADGGAFTFPKLAGESETDRERARRP